MGIRAPIRKWVAVAVRAGRRLRTRLDIRDGVGESAYEVGLESGLGLACLDTTASETGPVPGLRGKVKPLIGKSPPPNFTF